jgi:hypothetical protein
MAAAPDKPPKKSLMRNLGEFFGHIVRGVKSEPGGESGEGERHEVSRKVEEERRGDVVLRRTTIEEIEYKDE